MFKAVVILSLLFAAANAGYLGSPVAYSVAAPVAHVAPVAIKAAVPVATSYQNTYQISSGAVPVVAAAPVIKAAPIAYASPIVKVAAPALVKAPLLASPLSYGHY